MPEKVIYLLERRRRKRRFKLLYLAVVLIIVFLMIAIPLGGVENIFPDHVVSVLSKMGNVESTHSQPLAR